MTFEICLSPSFNRCSKAPPIFTWNSYLVSLYHKAYPHHTSWVLPCVILKHRVWHLYLLWPGSDLSQVLLIYIPKSSSAGLWVFSGQEYSQFDGSSIWWNPRHSPSVGMFETLCRQCQGHIWHKTEAATSGHEECWSSPTFALKSPWTFFSLLDGTDL